MKINKPIIQLRAGIVGGFLAVQLAILSQLLSVATLDSYLTNAVFLLAISIPLMGLDAYLLILELLTEKSVKSLLRGIARFISTILFFIAMSNLFFHFSLLAGIVFTITMLASLLIFVLYRFNRIVEEKQDTVQPAKSIDK